MSQFKVPTERKRNVDGRDALLAAVKEAERAHDFGGGTGTSTDPFGFSNIRKLRLPVSDALKVSRTEKLRKMAADNMDSIPWMTQTLVDSITVPTTERFHNSTTAELLEQMQIGLQPDTPVTVARLKQPPTPAQPPPLPTPPPATPATATMIPQQPPTLAPPATPEPLFWIQEGGTTRAVLPLALDGQERDLPLLSGLDDPALSSALEATDGSDFSPNHDTFGPNSIDSGWICIDSVSYEED